jgi:hypothetical protein
VSFQYFLFNMLSAYDWDKHSVCTWKLYKVQSASLVRISVISTWKQSNKKYLSYNKNIIVGEEKWCYILVCNVNETLVVSVSNIRALSPSKDLNMIS